MTMPCVRCGKIVIDCFEPCKKHKKKGETMTSKTQFKRMVPGDKILIEAGDQKMLIECHSWKRTILVYRPPTDEEIAEVYQ